MTKTEKELETMLQPSVEQLGYELYDIEFLKEGSEWYLRIFIDSKEKTIDLDDCEKVSNLIDPILDESDPISTAYSLEVSSCGLERHLREQEHYRKAIGKNIEVKLFKNIEDKKQFEGILKEVKDNSIAIELKNERQIEINIEEIAAAKILYDWEESENE